MFEDLFRFRKTVDGVLAGFQRTVNDLRAIGAREQETVNENHEEIRLLEAESAYAASERDRANAIADKLNALIS